MPTETKPLIYKALIEAQKAMDAVVKDTRNDFFKSSYAPLDKVIEVVYPTLHANGLAVTQTTGLQDGQFGLITTLWHESGESITGFYVLDPKEQHNPQMLGAAMTYARRYALMAILGIAPEDDDGNAASGATASRPTTPRPYAPAATPTRQVNTQTGEISDNGTCEYPGCATRIEQKWIDIAHRKGDPALCFDHKDLKDTSKWPRQREDDSQQSLPIEEELAMFPGAYAGDDGDLDSLMEGR